MCGILILHPSVDVLNKLCSLLSYTKLYRDNLCNSCFIYKSHRLPYQHVHENSTNRFDLLYVEPYTFVDTQGIIEWEMAMYKEFQALLDNGT